MGLADQYRATVNRQLMDERCEKCGKRGVLRLVSKPHPKSGEPLYAVACINCADPNLFTD